MVTGTTWPSQVGSPGRLTTVLPVVRPASSQARRRLVVSTRTSTVRPTDRSMQPGLDGLLQALERHDPAGLLRLGDVVRHPLGGQGVRARRVLEREHAVELNGLGQRHRLRRSPRPSLPGTRRSYRSRAGCPGGRRGAAARVRGSPRGCAGGASPSARATSPTAPAGAGACTPWAGRAARRSAAASSGAGAGWRSGSARYRRPRAPPRAAPGSRMPGRPAPGSDSRSGRAAAPPCARWRRAPRPRARISALARIRSCPRV